MPPPGGEGGDAAALFAARAAAAGAPLPATGSRVAGMCRALGGMPLAIELAAARLPSLGLDGLGAGLGDQLSLLSGGSRQQQRHRSLHDTLDWSYRLLDPREQAVLRRVAVFAGPFGLAAATAVAGYDPVEPARVADALGRLAEHSLLVPAAGAGGTRHHTLEPVRQFAAARLGADGDDDQRARRRHLAWCVTEAAGLDRADPAEPTWQTAFAAAADEFRAVVEVFHRAGGAEAAVAVARQRRGTQFDPQVVDVFTGQAASVFAGLDEASSWDAVIGAEPAQGRRLTGPEFDTALHRPARSAVEAAAQLRAEARGGRMDSGAAEAVLSAAGHPATRRPARPADLTGREVEVLQLLARGLSNREIAEHPVPSRRTAVHHVGHIYAKTGTTNRALASLFAANHGLIPDPATGTEAGFTPGTAGIRSTGPASR